MEWLAAALQSAEGAEGTHLISMSTKPTAENSRTEGTETNLPEREGWHVAKEGQKRLPAILQATTVGLQNGQSDHV